jgi:signal transduction histidine kinase
VRVRTTMAATLVVAVILAGAGVAFVAIQQHQLQSALEGIAAQEAADSAAQISRTGVTSIDLSGSGSGEQALVQIVTLDGRVLVSSPSVEGEPPVVDLRPAPGAVTGLTVDALAIGENEPYVIVARGVRSEGRDLVVIAAQSLETAERATAVVIGLLSIGYPVLLLLVAAIAYWLTGRALAPVEAIQRRVAVISATDLHARVPVPDSEDEIRALATTMNAMLSRLQAAGDAQRRFVADASHELRSPLTSIRAAHEIARAHAVEADWSVISTDVLAELDRLDRLVADLLLLAHVDEHGLRMQSQDVDLDDLLLDEAQRLRRHTDLEIELRAAPARVTGDRHHLARALRNLAENAAHHARTTITLGLETSSETVTIHVCDDGPGIPVADRERVFERFVRLDPSRDRTGGSAGLGLAIARDIARAHHGDLRVSPSDRGAHLMLSLPREGAGRTTSTVR